MEAYYCRWFPGIALLSRHDHFEVGYNDSPVVAREFPKSRHVSYSSETNNGHSTYLLVYSIMADVHVLREDLGNPLGEDSDNGQGILLKTPASSIT